MVKINANTDEGRKQVTLAQVVGTRAEGLTAAIDEDAAALESVKDAAAVKAILARMLARERKYALALRELVAREQG